MLGRINTMSVYVCICQSYLPKTLKVRRGGKESERGDMITNPDSPSVAKNTCQIGRWCPHPQGRLCLLERNLF